VLAQLQFGNLHVEGSQEYPAADELVVGPDMPPSCATARVDSSTKRRASGNMADENQARHKSNLHDGSCRVAEPIHSTGVLKTFFLSFQRTQVKLQSICLYYGWIAPKQRGN
jgi:hypothetical protein